MLVDRAASPKRPTEECSWSTTIPSWLLSNLLSVSTLITILILFTTMALAMDTYYHAHKPPWDSQLLLTPLMYNRKTQSKLVTGGCELLVLFCVQWTFVPLLINLLHGKFDRYNTTKIMIKCRTKFNPASLNIYFIKSATSAADSIRSSVFAAASEGGF